MNMTRNEEAKCHAIIHAASAAAGGVGAGLAQLPCSDNAVITPIQLGMIVSLGGVFGISVTRPAAEAAASSTAGAAIGMTLSQIIAGWIPGVGNAINAGTAVAVTEAMGWRIANQFARQR